jgi:anti-sigma-K factor RskA
MSEFDEHGPDFECAQSVDAAPYVLAALDEHEAEAFADHLSACAACRAEVAELQLTADSLALAAPQMVAPPDLRARIMSTVHAEAELLKAAGHEADQPVRARSRWRWSFVPAAAAAGAMAVGVLIGAVAINGGGESQHPSPAQQTKVTQALVSSPGNRATAALRSTDLHFQLEVANLPAPPKGRIYEVWLLRKGSTEPTPTDALFSVNTHGNGLIGIPGDLHGVVKVLVTDEPLGGSLKPTRNPIIVASV